MTEDARQSLMALVSATLFIGFFFAGLILPKGIDLPDWVFPLSGALLAIDFGWRFLRWARAKRAGSEETPT